MKTIKCDVGECKSLCILSPLDSDRVDDALKERGWTAKGTGKDAKHYCQFHKAHAEKKDDESTVPPAE